MTDTATDVQAIVDTTYAAAEPNPLDPGKVYAFVVPAGGSLQLADRDLDEYRDTPRRKQGTVVVHDAPSFITYFNAHSQTGGAVSVYADLSRQNLIAVLNDHADGSSDAAGWGDHRLHLVLTRTPTWQRWAAADRQLMSQVAFAEHIEESLLDITSPPAAEMLEIAQSFQATTKVNFESGTRLSSGQQQLTYVEETGARAGRKGELTIPQTFTIAVAPFDGSLTYDVTARLRYRVGEGKLRLGYCLDRPEEILRSAFTDILSDVETGIAAQALRGVPAP